MKPLHESRAKALFKNTKIKIITDGHRVLGSAVGDETFVTSYVSKLVSKWSEELETLSEGVHELNGYRLTISTPSAVSYGWRLLRRVTRVEEASPPDN